ncbi:MAG: hypothetical protein FJX75_10855 [Armatimonadetes bacterium]|nr:hypothetical protein [Armatimonadota bacterium]
MLCLLAVLPVAAQVTDTYTYGNRPIDKLPKSHYARPEAERGWDEPEPAGEQGLALHPKDLFRIGESGIERLCVVEAWGPQSKGEGAGYSLSLVERPQNVLWRIWPRWIGPNQRMRPYWLPIGSAERQPLILLGPGGSGGTMGVAAADTDLRTGAPWALIEPVATRPIHETDAGYALLPDPELVAVRGETLSLMVAVRPGHPGRDDPEVVVLLQPPNEAPRALCREPVRGRRQLNLASANWRWAQADLIVRVVAGRATLAERRLTVHLLGAAPQVTFGAREADLAYALPVKDGDTERSWYELWGTSHKRDVVVSFPGSDARFVFWRGTSYVGCWAFPEAWLCYEWLEAEPYFYGAVDCVEPIMDKDCRYSKAEIVGTTPARAVVKWSYALTDFETKIIRDEHAEETFTFYPDGIGTRFLRGFYTSGWHETQEFIVINRPGRWPSQALDPQAITFVSPTGERQAPVWPKPGFSLSGWPQVISIIRLGNGPYPFMVTADAPSQVKVWADPYVDKPDLFNSYPHWPVTRGMLTSWLTDPADFARPTHSNLANLVSDPIREEFGDMTQSAPSRIGESGDMTQSAPSRIGIVSPDSPEHDFLWLIGVCTSDQQALDAARCWLKPGRIEPGEGVASAEYSQIERAYLIRPTEGARTLRLALVPEDGTPIVNPAFIIEGWQGAAEASVEGSKRVVTGQEEQGLVVWAEGRFPQQTEVVLR